jgi:hypothetical protein
MKTVVAEDTKKTKETKLVLTVKYLALSGTE